MKVKVIWVGDADTAAKAEYPVPDHSNDEADCEG